MEGPRSFCGGPFQTNGYLLSFGGKTLLFDAPLGVKDWLRQKSLSPDLLILTHQHHDHIMDAAAVVETFGIPVWTHSDLDGELTLQSSLEAMTGMRWEIGEFTVERHLSEGALPIGDDEFQVLHIPGHSPDSLCFYSPEGGFVIGGDVLFQSSIGRTDLPNGNHDQLITGIREKLFVLPDDTVVYPGHGPPTDIGFEKSGNPFV